MPAKPVTCRKKLPVSRMKTALGLAKIEHSTAEAEEEHALHDYATGFLSLIVNLAFVIGSVCFFSEDTKTLEAGDWLFILASVFNVGLTAWVMVECLAASQDKEFEKDKHDEVLESFHYCISSVIFAIGSILFMPGLYSTVTMAFWGNEIGAWLFFFGSFGFLSAAYWNAMGMGARRTTGKADTVLAHAETRCSYIASVELWLLLVASALFVVGSFLYRPSLDTDCSDSSLLGVSHQPRSVLQGGFLQGKRGLSTATLRSDEAVHSAMPMCLSPATQGTWLYLIGSCIFVVQSLMFMARTTIMHNAHVISKADDVGQL